MVTLTIRYKTNWGQIGASYFRELLIDNLMKTPAVTIDFDESLNPVMQTCEMDLNVIYWDMETDRVKVLY